MPEPRVSHIVCKFLLVLCFLPQVALSQSDHLYRVELLVFSQPAGGSAEQWAATPELAYPSNARFLVYPGEQAAGTLTGGQSTYRAPAQVAGAGPTSIGVSPPGATQTMPFATLPHEQRTLAASASGMQRSGRYHILFHEVWTQPISSQAGAQSIVLDRSGDGGAWPALQGTIKLYLAQYFFLETNLWLNTQGEYLPGAWRMPPPPKGPPSDASRQAMLEERSAITTAQSLQSPATAGVAAEIGNEGGAAPTYPYRHAVLLKEARRIRSGEVIYIDHPLLGVLIKISTPDETVPVTGQPSAIPPPITPGP